jgi:hypothetical protein
MKNSTSRKTNVIGALAIACAGVTGAIFLSGGVNPPVADDSALSLLGRASTLEMPAVAAQLAAQTPLDTREAKAVEILRAVNGLAGSSALPFVVGAMSESSPSVAAAVAGEASQLQPAASLPCVKAAISAAPVQTAAIVSSVVQQQPSAYSRVVLVAGDTVPTRSAEILGGLSAALPQLQPLVSRAVGQAASQPELASVMTQVGSMVTSAAQGELAAVRSQTTPGAAIMPEHAVFMPLLASTQKGPPVVTPLTPPVVPPTEKTVGDTVPQSGNDRDYSAP